MNSELKGMDVLHQFDSATRQSATKGHQKLALKMEGLKGTQIQQIKLARRHRVLNSWNQVVTNHEGEVVASRDEIEAQSKRFQAKMMNNLYKSTVSKRLILGQVEELQEMHKQKIHELMELKQLEGYMRPGREGDTRSRRSGRNSIISK